MGVITTLAGRLGRSGSARVIDKPRDRVLDERIPCGAAGLRTARTKPRQDNIPYLSVRPDDPSFGVAIKASWS